MRPPRDTPLDMRTYGQFCPIAQALEVLGERWTLLVVRELLCGSQRFSELLQGVPLMPRSVLSQRLKSLECAGIVERRERDDAHGHAYHLTEAGEELRPLVMSLGGWGQRWAKRELNDETLDASLLMWDIHRRIDHDAVTRERTMIRFEFSDRRRGQRRYWLHLHDHEAEVCFTNPGFDEDLVVETDVRTLTEIWMGHRELRAALRDKSVVLQGPPTLRDSFGRLLQLSLFAGIEVSVPRAAQAKARPAARMV